MGLKIYDANSISVLESLEAVRTRPGMYIGYTRKSYSTMLGENKDK